VRCDDVAVALSESADGSSPLPRGAHRHVERCLRCQAEQAQYRKVMRTMRSLRPQLVEPAPGLLVEILLGIEEDEGRGAIRSILDRHRVAYVAAATAATAATAAGAIVIAARTRRPASA
jgi:hypothetical protein